MPCSSGGSGPSYHDISVLRDELELLTRVCCDLAQFIRKVNMFDVLKPETQRWVIQHEEIDRQREAARK